MIKCKKCGLYDPQTEEEYLQIVAKKKATCHCNTITLGGVILK